MESNLNVHDERASFSTLTLKKKILISKTFIHGKMFTKILNKKHWVQSCINMMPSCKGHEEQKIK